MRLPVEAALAFHILDRTNQQQIIRQITTYMYMIGLWSTAKNVSNIPYHDYLHTNIHTFHVLLQ